MAFGYGANTLSAIHPACMLLTGQVQLPRCTSSEHTEGGIPMHWAASRLG